MGADWAVGRLEGAFAPWFCFRVWPLKILDESGGIITWDGSCNISGQKKASICSRYSTAFVSVGLFLLCWFQEILLW